jgi:hypothetical protein
MAITRAQVETELVARTKDLLDYCGLSYATDGTNPDLNSPLAFAMRNSQQTLIDPTVATDYDFSVMDPSDLDEIYDLAEYRLLLSILNRMTAVRTQVGVNAFYWSELRDSIDKRIARMQGLLDELYGYGRGTLEAGVIQTSGAEIDPTLTEPFPP